MDKKIGWKMNESLKDAIDQREILLKRKINKFLFKEDIYILKNIEKLKRIRLVLLVLIFLSLGYKFYNFGFSITFLNLIPTLILIGFYYIMEKGIYLLQELDFLSKIKSRLE